MKEINERNIERYLVTCVKALGGEVRKVSWIGLRSAPDRLVMLPARIEPTGGRDAKTFWVKLKAPGKKATAAQQREHQRMRYYRMEVSVVDSFERVDEVLA
jgi:hypothetical protein